MAGIVNKKAIYTKIFNSRKLLNRSRSFALKKVESNKQILIKEFDSHPVTQEIQNGSSAFNISNTLGGYGNLFSFIGFPKGSNPITPVINMLQTIKLGPLKIQKRNKTFRFKVIVPSKQNFYNITKMPWENGRSWLFDIEKSISGLGSYLYLKYENSKSRSGTGIQLDKNYKKVIFKPVRYFNTMYNKFLIRVSK